MADGRREKQGNNGCRSLRAFENSRSHRAQQHDQNRVTATHRAVSRGSPKADSPRAPAGGRSPRTTCAVEVRVTTGVGHGNAYLETLWEKISDDRYEYAEQRSPVAHFLMVRILTLVSFAAPERTCICLRRGRLRILEYECSVEVCVFGRCWSCVRPHACRRAAPLRLENWQNGRATTFGFPRTEATSRLRGNDRTTRRAGVVVRER